MEAAVYPYVDEWGDRYDLAFERTHYETNGRLAVEAWCRSGEGGPWVPYATVTINLWGPIDGEDCAYLDTNDSPGLVRWLIDQGHVGLIPRTAQSGFCEYQEGRFTMEFLKSCITDDRAPSFRHGAGLGGR